MWALNENVKSVFRRVGTTRTSGIRCNMFVMKVGLGVQPVSEVEPSKYLDSVGDLGEPDGPSMSVAVVLSHDQPICRPRGEGAAADEEACVHGWRHGL